MRWLKYVTIAMLVWGSSVFANGAAPDINPTPQLQLITDWMAHLNLYKPDLQVSTHANLQSAAVRGSVLGHLKILQGVVRGEESALPGQLFDLDCGNIVCGDGPPGHCSVCGSP